MKEDTGIYSIISLLNALSHGCQTHSKLWATYSFDVKWGGQVKRRKRSTSVYLHDKEMLL